MRRKLTFVSEFIVFPFIGLLILIWLKVPLPVMEFLVSLWMAVLYGIVLMFMFSSLTSRKSTIKGSLFGWMEELTDNDENLTFQLKRVDIRYKTIDNLLAIKETILKATDGNLERLKLYKAFYSLSLKESTEELYYKIIIGLISSVGVFVLRDQVSKVEENKLTDLIFIGLIIVFSILAFVGAINENKKRIGLVIEILEICIEEIETVNEDNKKKESV
ncbi:hypothetical protein [Planococcus shenhongbingii]|uniref:MotA/TolQ/ExbB proton channel domain-containing protein n=1 Tax=Planococcus shenhongbingii TaxID=3058398 RepID=A0ABT8N7W7_9BACL|nr:hypothetical protein [Planococcus sp. N017]MDN7243974.1 hypothetical protein [Planococcus sp. N017]